MSEARFTVKVCWLFCIRRRVKIREMRDQAFLFPVLLLFGLIIGCAAPIEAPIELSKMAAKKKEKVVIFGTLDKVVVKKIQVTFEKKYPSIERVYWRGSTSAIMKKAIGGYGPRSDAWAVARD